MARAISKQKDEHGRRRQALFVTLLNKLTDVSAHLAAVHTAYQSEAGLTRWHRRILRALRENGPQTISQMAAMMQISRQYVQIVVGQLLDRELIRKEDNPFHKRSYLIAITDKGATAFRELLRSERPWGRQLIENLDEARLQDVFEVLSEVDSRLEQILVGKNKKG